MLGVKKIAQLTLVGICPNLENVSSTTQWCSVPIIIITSHLCIRTIATYLYMWHMLPYEITAVLSLIINSSQCTPLVAVPYLITQHLHCGP